MVVCPRNDAGLCSSISYIGLDDTRCCFCFASNTDRASTGNVAVICCVTADGPESLVAHAVARAGQLERVIVVGLDVERVDPYQTPEVVHQEAALGSEHPGHRGAPERAFVSPSAIGDRGDPLDPVEERRRPAAPSPSVALFAATVFASAFLIFFVQPMVGKHILPWFGGAPAVWLVCVAFYQLTLFFGYGYAHLLNQRLASSRQLVTHAILFAAALLVLPVLPDESWKPQGGAPPSLHILAMLASNVGPPFLLLAATGPLLQAWFARAFPGRSPYGLYAVSNAGSLLALLAYPFFVEPLTSLSSQSAAWSWAFAACGLAILACGWQAWGGARALAPIAAQRSGDTAPAEKAAGMPGADPAADGDATRTLLWIFLPACAVVLFMGVTNELCLDVASIPFLWIVPLAIYLTTFIICFGSERLYRRGLFATLALLSAALLIAARVGTVDALTLGKGASPIAILAVLYSLALFFSCMLVHGELYRLRPSPERLTAYYFCVSGGGALGGLFVAIAAPRIFSEYYELPFGGLACLLFSTLACLKNPGPLLGKTRRAQGAGERRRTGGRDPGRAGRSGHRQPVRRRPQR